MTKKLVNKIYFGLFLNISLLAMISYLDNTHSFNINRNWSIFYGFGLMPIHILACLIMLLFISSKLFTIDSKATFSTRDKVLIFLYYISFVSIFLYSYIPQ